MPDNITGRVSFERIGGFCGIISGTAGHWSARQSLTRLLDCTERGLAVKATSTTPRCAATQDCLVDVHASGYCKPHYLRWKRHGDPLAGGPFRTKPTVAGFWMAVDKNGPVPAHRPELGQCWVWTGRLDRRGYGIARLPGFRQPLGAHRAAWWLTHSELSSREAQLDHLCRNRACTNPAHLEVVTSAVNNQRSTSPAARNFRKTHCDHGHEFTPENTADYGDGRVCRTCQNEKARQYRRRQGAQAR